jgi:hypothetical protein
MLFHDVVNSAFFHLISYIGSQRDLLEDYSTAAAEHDPFAMLLSKKV